MPAHVLCRSFPISAFRRSLRYVGSTVKTSTTFFLPFIHSSSIGEVLTKLSIGTVATVLTHAKGVRAELDKLPLTTDESFQLNRAFDLDDECGLFGLYKRFEDMGSANYDGSSTQWKKIRDEVIISMIGSCVEIIFKWCKAIWGREVDFQTLGNRGNYADVQDFRRSMNMLDNITVPVLELFRDTVRADGHLMCDMSERYSQAEIRDIRAERKRQITSMLQKRHGVGENLTAEDVADALLALNNDVQVLQSILQHR